MTFMNVRVLMHYQTNITLLIWKMILTIMRMYPRVGNGLKKLPAKLAHKLLKTLIRSIGCYQVLSPPTAHGFLVLAEDWRMIAATKRNSGKFYVLSLKRHHLRNGRLMSSWDFSPHARKAIRYFMTQHLMI